jgi:hypothetical protein
MYGGAAVTIIGILVNLTTLGNIRQQRPIMSEALRTSTQNQAVVEFIVGGLLVATIWAFMAVACRNGMSWARITGTVLFAIDTVYVTELVVGLDNVHPPGAVKALAIVMWFFGLAATVLLWQRAASPHFSFRGRGARGTREAHDAK